MSEKIIFFLLSMIGKKEHENHYYWSPFCQSAFVFTYTLQWYKFNMYVNWTFKTSVWSLCTIHSHSVKKMLSGYISSTYKFWISILSNKLSWQFHSMIHKILDKKSLIHSITHKLAKTARMLYIRKLCLLGQH